MALRALDYLMRRFRRFPDAVIGRAFMHPDEPKRDTIPAYRRLIEAQPKVLREQGLLELLRIHSGARARPARDGIKMTLEIRGYDPDIGLPLEPELDDGILTFATLLKEETRSDFGLSCEMRPPGVYRRIDDGFPGPWERCAESFVDWFTELVVGEYF